MYMSNCTIFSHLYIYNIHRLSTYKYTVARLYIEPNTLTYSLQHQDLNL